MRKVDPQRQFNSGDDLRKWWEAWQKEAETATGDIIHLWETTAKIAGSDFKSTVWGDLKAKLLAHVFHGKCAYCETNLGGARQSGHGEHFRPKLSPNYRPANNRHSPCKPAQVQRPEQTRFGRHPGYFWLAYDWRNLLPSCELCNTSGGKHNQFPLKDPGHYTLLVKLSAKDPRRSRARPSVAWPGYFYLAPPDIDPLERPQLINPYFDSPEDHLTFDELGHIAAITERGEQTIKVCRLDDDALNRRRQAELERVVSRVFAARLSQLTKGYAAGVHEAATNLVEAVRGTAEYSAAVLAACKIHNLEPVIKEARAITGPG